MEARQQKITFVWKVIYYATDSKEMQKF